MLDRVVKFLRPTAAQQQEEKQALTPKEADAARRDLEHEIERKRSEIESETRRYERHKQDRLVYSAPQTALLVGEPERQQRVYDAEQMIPYYEKSIAQQKAKLAWLEKMLEVGVA